MPPAWPRPRRWLALWRPPALARRRRWPAPGQAPLRRHTPPAAGRPIRTSPGECSCSPQDTIGFLVSDGAIAAALAQAVNRFGDAEAFVFPTARLTFRQLAERARAGVRAFLAAGIGRGDCVAVWLADYPEWPELYFGLASIGAVLVPVNTRYKPHEVEYVLDKSGARALVFKDEVAGD